MIEYLVLVNNSPLLIDQISPKAHKYASKTLHTYVEIVKELKEKNIKHLITISTASTQEKNSFGVTIHPNLFIEFSVFGDLVTKVGLKPWWKAYYDIRSSAQIILEPIDKKTIDYTHGVPLYELSKHISLESLSILPITDHALATHQERVALGESLQQIFDRYQEPIAVIVSGSLHATTSAKRKTDTQQLNKELEKNAQSGLDGFSLDQGILPDGVIKQTFTGPTQIAAALCKNLRLSYEELAFEHTEFSSFLTARYL